MEARPGLLGNSLNGKCLIKIKLRIGSGILCHLRHLGSGPSSMSELSCVDPADLDSFQP